VPCPLGLAFELFVRLYALPLQGLSFPLLRLCLHAVLLFRIHLCFLFHCKSLVLVLQKLSRRLSDLFAHKTRVHGFERFFLHLFFPLQQQSSCPFCLRCAHSKHITSTNYAKTNNTIAEQAHINLCGCSVTITCQPSLACFPIFVE